LENPIDGPLATLESDEDEFSLATGIVEADTGLFDGFAYEDQIKVIYIT